jgi:RNA polymerase sigma-70 factor, ECF subfamily
MQPSASTLEFPDLLYADLRRIAAAHLRRERPGHTLQPTALVHEAYLQLAETYGDLYKKSRAHFMALASTVMRQVLVHYARRRNAVKRGGGGQKVTLDEGLALTPNSTPDVLAIDQALRTLSNQDARKARMIELRYFGGLTDQEIAEVMEVSLSTVGRDIRFGLALLNRSLQ